MRELDLVTALLGALVLLMALPSRRTSESWLPPTLLALLGGIVVGPRGLGWLDGRWLLEAPEVREGLARLTLGIGLVGVALRVPAAVVRREWRPVAVLVGVGMPLTWLLSSALTWLVLDLPLWVAALVGAIVTPTDPVAATPIVTGRIADENIPAEIRHTLSYESGINDGLGYLLVMLSVLMLTHPPGEAIRLWLGGTLLWEVGVALLLGVALGIASGRLLAAAESRDTIEGEWRLIYTVAVALLALGVGRILGSDEILVAFAAGAAFVQVVPDRDRAEEEQGQEAVNRFFAIPIFAVIGAAIPWDAWIGLGWRGPAVAVGLLLLRRIPVILLLRPWIAPLRSRREALFAGWFGPVAVAALYYASLVEHRLEDPRTWHVVSLVICTSVVLHGVTGAPLSRRLGRSRRRSRGVGAPGQPSFPDPS